MHELKTIILPSDLEVRVWAQDPTRSWRVQATLPCPPSHPDALPRLLMALGSFLPVRAALAVPERAPSYATSLYPGWFGDVGSESYYALKVISDSRRDRHRWWRSP